MSQASTAGIADPYWYEWSVGLTYIVEMLAPDNHIAAVTLQATGIKGLDDVVVQYTNGTKRLIQVKHTRSADTFTFGDLVTPDKNDDVSNQAGEKRSLLQALALAWKDAATKGQACEAYIFTNRAGGTRASSTQATNSEPGHRRPPLVSFWPSLKVQVSKAQALSDVVFEADFHDAWTEWLEQLKDLSATEQIDFMRTLEIQTGQPDLDALEVALIKKLATFFAISEDHARTLLPALDHGLRTWTTSRRAQEAITPEMVYAALSLSAQQEQYGDHQLPPPEPFFPSRATFVDCLAAALRARKQPICLLTGNPGAGKTSVVSALANRHDPVIDLRFFAYKPITPSSPILPADAGKTTSSRALWSDLLTQLRKIFQGRLARFRVPVRNEFLSVEQLRAHVLRLAGALSAENGRPTTIAIDGIDHAARAGVTGQENLLDSLVPPDAVPENVCFLIAGQPRNEKYPSWLKGSHDRVWNLSVPDSTFDDVQTLVRRTTLPIASDQLEATARLIHDLSAGSTLAAVFAVQEATFCTTVTELSQRLADRRLGDGLMSYYDAIWAHAVIPLQTRLDLPDLLAGTIAFASTRLTAKRLADIHRDTKITESEWSAALRKMRPLLIEEQQGKFRIYHNDVRVYLHHKLSEEPEAAAHVAGRLADFYANDPGSTLEKHVDLFRLLIRADRKVECARHFTPYYVLEGFANDRTLAELVEQSKIALESAILARDWGLLHQVACATNTASQIYDALRW